ncbi:hypothetical protein [Polaromonas sp.]|uniref:hypothetical protein n=1 Tax=Polaromonas sp. TaxID=1869339 RepID=UPI0025E2A4C3|nr:hypothetical protein [Polaromonas sp.]
MPSSQRSEHPTAPGVESIRVQWLLVCRSRGTPAPDPARALPFLAGLTNLHGQAFEALTQALVLCLKGQEKRRELEVLAWAAGCTRPTLLAQLQAQGIVCTGHDLFGVGLGLMASGWDMSARLAQLVQHPEDVTSLRQALALQASASRLALEVPALPARADATAPVDPAGPDQDRAPALQPERSQLPRMLMPSVSAPERRMDNYPPLAVVPDAPSEFPEWDGCEFEVQDPNDAAPASPRLQVKLFGSNAAHTLEIGTHRRSTSFMGVQVVTIESARALGSGGSGGYDWGHKLTVQLTPEEMPGAMAVLMNLYPSVRFGQHGAARDKFVELRRQDGGMVLVTGQGSAVYAVPVKTPQLYYLLGLFARAMAQGLPGGSVAEVLALVKASQ